MFRPMLEPPLTANTCIRSAMIASRRSIRRPAKCWQQSRYPAAAEAAGAPRKKREALFLPFLPRRSDRTASIPYSSADDVCLFKAEISATPRLRKADNYVVEQCDLQNPRRFR